MKENQEASAKQTAADSQAYRYALKERLIAAENITDNYLNILAMNRQRAILDHLSVHAQMEAGRLNKQVTAETDAEPGRG